MLLEVTLLIGTSFYVFVAVVLEQLIHCLALVLVSGGYLGNLVYSNILVKEFNLRDMGLLFLLVCLNEL